MGHSAQGGVTALYSLLANVGFLKGVFIFLVHLVFPVLVVISKGVCLFGSCLHYDVCTLVTRLAVNRLIRGCLVIRDVFGATEE